MHGVLGGFKNMLRTWRNNLRKKKRKEELENSKKITKFPRLQSFLYSTLAIIYWPIGSILFSKSKTTVVKQEQPKLYKQIQEVSFQLDKVLLKQDKEQIQKKMVKIEKEVKKIKREIKKPMSTQSQQYFYEKTQELEEKVKYLNSPMSQKKEIPIVSKKEETKQGKNKPSIQGSKRSLKLQPAPIFIPITKQETVNQSKKDNRIEYIKKANKELKEMEEQVKEIASKIGATTVYNSLYTLENKLKELTKKLDVLKQQYQELKIDEVVVIFPFDKKELSKSPKKIEELIEKVNISLKTIDSKKDELFYKKVEKVKKEEEKVKTTKEKQQRDKKETKEVNDALYAQELLLHNIVNQNKLFEEYMKKLNHSKNKKRTLFSSLLSFSRNIVNFSLSLLPFSFFKNKIVGTFLSTVMINNSIKTMRRMANPDLEVNYEVFDKAYFEGKNLLESSYYMCESSLHELAKLKDELILLGANKEAVLLLKQLEQLENNIEMQKQNLNYKKNKLDKVYTKLKKTG